MVIPVTFLGECIVMSVQSSHPKSYLNAGNPSNMTWFQYIWSSYDCCIASRAAVCLMLMPPLVQLLLHSCNCSSKWKQIAMQHIACLLSVDTFREYTEITTWGLFKIGVPPYDHWVHILTYGYVMSVYVQFLRCMFFWGNTIWDTVTPVYIHDK